MPKIFLQIETRETEPGAPKGEGLDILIEEAILNLDLEGHEVTFVTVSRTKLGRFHEDTGTTLRAIADRREKCVFDEADRRCLYKIANIIDTGK